MSEHVAIDQRVAVFVRIADEYGLMYNESEAEELLEIFDRVTREVDPEDIRYSVKVG